MDLGLEDKVVIITGGSGGIGRGLVKAFADEGARVAIATRDEDKAREIAATVGGQPGQALVVPTDVTDRAAVERLLERVEAHWGPVEVLVNNAGGVAYPRPTLEKPREEVQWELDLNIWGVIHCTEIIGRSLVEAGRGAIVNITSNSALSPTAANQVVHYAGAKGFVMSFSKGLAYEWGPQGVRINCVAPGWIVPWNENDVGEGSFWKKYGYAFFGTPEEMAVQAEKGELFNASDQPIPRIGRPEDVADLAVFLASHRAAHITGQLVSVSGGAWMP